jgi:hypothetical protein
MTCETIMLPDGTSGIVCGRARRKRQCEEPGCFAPGEYQCDAPVVRKKRGGGTMTGTCDKYLCAGHRVARGPGVDFCPEHAAELADHCVAKPILKRAQRYAAEAGGLLKLLDDA